MDKGAQIVVEKVPHVSCVYDGSEDKNLFVEKKCMQTIVHMHRLKTVDYLFGKKVIPGNFCRKPSRIL